jgi:hypothetical protein
VKHALPTEKQSAELRKEREGERLGGDVGLLLLGRNVLNGDAPIRNMFTKVMKLLVVEMLRARSDLR